MTITIDTTRDNLLSDFSKATLQDRYLLEGETIQEGFARAAKAFASNPQHAQRIYEYASKQWFMFSSPILSNGGTNKGLPISCYLNYVPDSREGILSHYEENGWLASMGGGIGGYWGPIRSDGTTTSHGSRSTGSIPFMHVVDSEMLAFSQGTTRRGSYAAYQDISHPEIEEFILMRKPTGGDPHRKCLNLHHGVNINDAFMEAVKHGNSWPLVDPHTGNTTKEVSARSLWQLLLETRLSTGEPYIHYVDTTNRYLPVFQWKNNLRVHQSNLCSEITLPTNEERTAVCCLSSVNLEKYDEWKNEELFIHDLVEFLDNVLTSFIEKAPDALSKAKYSASQERSIGLGAMGFHNYLQSKNIPFDSPIAVGLNRKIFQGIKIRAEIATSKLAEERGEAPDAEGCGVRNCHLLAIAPNATSSILANTSPSIEPNRANAYVHKTMSGSFLVKNKFLETLLEAKGKNTEEVWQSITVNRGSVQHLDCLDEWDKQVYRTAIEIDQNWIIQHAADRQPFICQAQSLNLFFSSDVDISYFHRVHFKAWELELKTLYYCRSEAISRADIVSQRFDKYERKDGDSGGDCFACEG